jgi:hypothetical protein
LNETQRVTRFTDIEEEVKVPEGGVTVGSFGDNSPNKEKNLTSIKFPTIRN